MIPVSKRKSSALRNSKVEHSPKVSTSSHKFGPMYLKQWLRRQNGWMGELAWSNRSGLLVGLLTADRQYVKFHPSTPSITENVRHGLKRNKQASRLTQLGRGWRPIWSSFLQNRSSRWNPRLSPWTPHSYASIQFEACPENGRARQQICQWNPCDGNERDE